MLLSFINNNKKIHSREESWGERRWSVWTRPSTSSRWAFSQTLLFSGSKREREVKGLGKLFRRSPPVRLRKTLNWSVRWVAPERRIRRPSPDPDSSLDLHLRRGCNLTLTPSFFSPTRIAQFLLGTRLGSNVCLTSRINDIYKLFCFISQTNCNANN